MSRLKISLLFVGLLSFAFLREASSEGRLVHEIAPGVFFREAERDKQILANTGWIVFRDYVLVIDANYPWGAKAILPDIRKTTGKPIRYVFNTHYHSDHAFGSSQFVDAGATIVCTEECTAESRVKNRRTWDRDEAVGDFSLKPYRLEHPTLSFPDKLVFDDGEKRVELIRLGPAHTRGDAVAWLPKERILFSGDLCVHSPGNNMLDVDTDPDHWLTALDTMLAWRPAQIVTGHGVPGAAEPILRGQRAYLGAMIGGVRSGLARGAAVEQIIKDTDLSAHAPWGTNAERNESALRSIYGKLRR